MPIEGLTLARKVGRDFVANQIPKKVEATAKEVARYALERAIDFSPFVTGRFAASWRVAVGEAEQGYAIKGRRSIESAKAEAGAASSGAINSLKFGMKFSLQNNLPYSGYVEYGSPTTSPHYVAKRVAQSIGAKFGKIT